VPEGEALLAGRARARALEPVLESAVRYAADRGVQARPVLKLARRVSVGIIETAREEQCNFLVLGQPVSGSLLERLVASIVEHVLQRAPCQVGVVFGTFSPATVRGIAVPVTGGANPRLAATLAPAIATALRVPVRALSVIPHDATGEDADERIREAREAAAAAGCEDRLEVIRSNDVTRALLDALRPGEVVLMGAPSTAPVAALVGTTVPGAIAAERRHPVFRERRSRRHVPTTSAAAV
jgi:hypothetical protein